MDSVPVNWPRPLARYIDVAARITTCALGKCDDLIAWLLRYLTDFKTMSMQQLASMLRARLLGPIDQAVAAFTSADAALAAGMDSVRQASQELAADAADAVAAVSTLHDAAKALEGIRTVVKAAAAAADAAAAATTSPVAIVTQLVTEGKATSLTAIADLVSSVQGLPDAAKALERLPTLSRDISSALASLKAASAKLESTADASALQSLMGGISSLEKAAASLSAIRKLDVASAVVSYNRYATISLSIPCDMESSRKCLRISGEEACANVPSMKMCEERFKIPLPNHHIPVIKIRLS